MDVVRINPDNIIEIIWDKVKRDPAMDCITKNIGKQMIIINENNMGILIPDEIACKILLYDPMTTQ